jgi:hypothetical protein
MALYICLELAYWHAYSRHTYQQDTHSLPLVLSGTALHAAP